MLEEETKVGGGKPDGVSDIHKGEEVGVTEVTIRKVEDSVVVSGGFPSKLSYRCPIPSLIFFLTISNSGVPYE